MMESQAVEAPNQEQSMSAAVAWLAAANNLAYTTVIYYGVAPPPGGLPTDWWHGRTFILDMESMGGYVDNPAGGALLIGIPAAILSIVVFRFTRSATARALTLGTTIAAMILALLGYAAAYPWENFSWRFTVVAVASGMALGSAIVAPLLAKSWLRLSGVARAAIYLPIFFFLMAAVRGATGTSEYMQFMVSPWPAFTSFALDSGVTLIAGMLFSMSLGVLSLSRGFAGVHSAVGLVIALAIPGIFFHEAVMEATPTWFLGLTVLALLLILAATRYRGNGDKHLALQTRGFLLGLGGALAFFPVFAGHALASGDYVVNRYVRAPKVIEALQAHIVREEFYPESLSDLVEARYYDETPRPRIGFGFLSDLGLDDEVKYRYNEYGSSYVLEFDSSLWIQCSYSGQYYFDDEEEEEYLDDEDYEDEKPEWSCLGKAPSLMDASADEEEEYDDEDYDE
jgi:hypothetical protein